MRMKDIALAGVGFQPISNADSRLTKSQRKTMARITKHLFWFVVGASGKQTLKLRQAQMAYAFTGLRLEYDPYSQSISYVAQVNLRGGSHYTATNLHVFIGPNGGVTAVKEDTRVKHSYYLVKGNKAFYAGLRH